MLPALQAIASSYASIKGNQTSLQNIKEEIITILNQDEVLNDYSNNKFKEFNIIEFENLNFSHKNNLIFNNINIEIKKSKLKRNLKKGIF